MIPGQIGALRSTALGIMTLILFTPAPQENVVLSVIHAVGCLQVFLVLVDLNRYGYFYKLYAIITVVVLFFPWDPGGATTLSGISANITLLAFLGATPRRAVLDASEEFNTIRPDLIPKSPSWSPSRIPLPFPSSAVTAIDEVLAVL